MNVKSTFNFVLERMHFNFIEEGTSLNIILQKIKRHQLMQILKLLNILFAALKRRKIQLFSFAKNTKTDIKN